MQDVLAGQARWAVVCADALEALSHLPDGCCDSIVTDPPAGIAFMGKEWDRPDRFPLRERGPLRGTPEHAAHAHERGFANGMHIDSSRRARDTFITGLAAVFTECRRVIKPGGYALVWALPRTSHWTGLALEEAGFELRDQISHLFGSGFPKSHSCLKPAHEVWWLAKAPGPLQPLRIDAARVPTATSGEDPRGQGRPKGAEGCFPFSDDAWGNGHLRHTEGHAGGRWPPNTLLSHVGGPDGCQPAGVRRVRDGGRECVYDSGKGTATPDGYETVDAWTCHPQCPVRLLDAQAGPRTSGGYPPAGGLRSHVATYGMPNERGEQRFTSSTGHASRFFPTFAGAPDPEDVVPFRYCSKAPARERRLADGTPTGHPTQKPVALAQWLVTLVCRPGGTVLDPFAGVASLGIGALRAGCHYIGIEQDAAYAAVAQRRLGEEQEQQAGPLFAGLAAQR